MKTNLKLLAMAALIAFSMAIPNAQADHKFRGKGEGKNFQFQDKVLHKAHFILEKEKELGLTPDQVKTIREIKLQAKKTKIQLSSQADIIGVDLFAEFHNDSVNLDKVNALIDQKFEVKKELAKEMAASFVKLKSVLTPEQQGKLKELFQTMRKDFKDCKLAKKCQKE